MADVAELVKLLVLFGRFILRGGSDLEGAWEYLLEYRVVLASSA